MTATPASGRLPRMTKTSSEIIAEVKAAYPGAWCHKDLGWMGPGRTEAAALEHNLRVAAGLGPVEAAPVFATGKPVEITRSRNGVLPPRHRDE